VYDSGHIGKILNRQELYTGRNHVVLGSVYNEGVQ